MTWTRANKKKKKVHSKKGVGNKEVKLGESAHITKQGNAKEKKYPDRHTGIRGVKWKIAVATAGIIWWRKRNCIGWYHSQHATKNPEIQWHGLEWLGKMKI